MRFDSRSPLCWFAAKCRSWVAGLFIALAVVFSANAQEITIGVLAHRGEEVANARWAQTARYLEYELDSYQFKLLPLSLEGVSASLENGDLDFLLTNPGHYIAIADRFRLTRIASLKTDRYGKPITGNRFGAVIFTRAAADNIKTISDLKGKTFAAVSPDAFGGFLAAASTFQHNGIDPYSELKAIKYMGFPQDEIVEAVMRGEEDSGTVRTGIIESMISDGRISAADVKILNPQTIDGFELLLSTQLFPEWTFTAASNASPLLKKTVARALFSMDENSAAAVAGRYGGWGTPMFNGNVRQLMAQRISGPGKTRWSAEQLTAAIAALLASIVAGYYLLNGALRSVLARRKQSETEAEFLRLTPRENQVLGHVISGKTSKEVARELEISPKTVEFHRKNLMKKLKAENLADLVRIAIDRQNARV